MESGARLVSAPHSLGGIRIANAYRADIARDPVYEGESKASLIDLISSGDIERTSTVLYVHLEGQPALNAYGTFSQLTHPQ